MNEFASNSCPADAKTSPGDEEVRQVHVVAVPCPLHGHTAPFVQLCELLARKCTRVTIVSTPRFQPRKRWQQPNVHVRLILDGLPPDYKVCISDFPTYLRHVESLKLPFHALVAELVAESPPVTCLLSDTHLGWVQDVADSFGLPRFCFLTSSVTEFSVLFHQPLLLARGILPFQDGENQVISCVPGLPPTKQNEFPSFLQVADPSDFEFQYFMRQIGRVAEADRLLVASFEDLEAEVIHVLAKELPIQPIGPLLLHGSDDVGEVDACEQWLDKQAPNSVIYIAFGTLASLEMKEIEAIARGLEVSKHPFLWVLRDDSLTGQASLPTGFRDNCNGLVVPWSQQQQILKHRSIGAFLTHCGWGSTLEAICNGVPLLCWPLYGDQFLNCNLLVDKWHAGVKIAPGLASRRKSLSSSHVASSIATVMGSSTYRCNMRNLQARAKGACASTGSSKVNFQQLIDDLHVLSECNDLTRK